MVARFLALLELFREGAVAFDQAAPLGELTVRWTGSDQGDVDVEDEFDDFVQISDDVVQVSDDVVQVSDDVVVASGDTTAIDLTGQDGPRDPVD